jgi:cytochrome c553
MTKNDPSKYPLQNSVLILSWYYNAAALKLGSLIFWNLNPIHPPNRLIKLDQPMKQTVKNTLITLSLMAVASLSFAPWSLAAGDAKAGATKTAVCAACHAADGNSAAGNFPKLAGLGEKYLLKQLQDIQAWDLQKDPAKKGSTGRAVVEMTGMLATMNAQDLADIAAHYAAQTMQLKGSVKSEVRVNSGIKVDALELGERIYRSGNLTTGVPACTGCHSPNGSGNTPAGFPRLGGQHPEYIEKQLRAFRAGERVNDGDQQFMRAVADKLSDAEIIALANYIAGLH